MRVYNFAYISILKDLIIPRCSSSIVWLHPNPTHVIRTLEWNRPILNIQTKYPSYKHKFIALSTLPYSRHHPFKIYRKSNIPMFCRNTNTI